MFAVPVSLASDVRGRLKMETPEYARRIQTAREIAGKSMKEMASLLDMSIAEYRDLESFDDEVLTCVSLKQVEELCKALGISTEELLSVGQPLTEQGDRITLHELTQLIGGYVQEQQISVEEFETRAGWGVKAALENCEQALEWNLVGLIDVCRQIGVNWLNVVLVHEPPET